MVAGKRKVRHSRGSIARGRPPFSQRQKATLSSKATRVLISSHHNLQKEHAKAVAAGDDHQAHNIQKKIDAKGGLLSYQIASTLGQSRERGGDSSKVLVEWMKHTFNEAYKTNGTLRMLEIGALSTRNACSEIKGLDVRRIDLHSQETSIEEIDFMNLALPKSPDKSFDVVSLSLVLNFVPDPITRGEMLKRLPSFLRRSQSTSLDSDLPCLFLVLPSPCITNSRYLTKLKLEEILVSLGFTLRETKTTSKLFYSLWRLNSTQSSFQKSFKKEELRPGGHRNNFAIVLK